MFLFNKYGQGTNCSTIVGHQDLGRFSYKVSLSNKLTFTSAFQGEVYTESPWMRRALQFFWPDFQFSLGFCSGIYDLCSSRSLMDALFALTKIERKSLILTHCSSFLRVCFFYSAFGAKAMGNCQSVTDK